MDQMHSALNGVEFVGNEAELRESHHRIANDLAVIGSMIRLQALALRNSHAPIEPEEARALLEEAAGRIEAVGRLHRTLCMANAEVVAASFISDICRDAASFAGAIGSDISCRVNLKREIPHEQLRTLGLLAHELVLNALKHSHPAGVAVIVEVWCEEDEEGRLVLGVSDDGVGLPESFSTETGGGFGFRMIRELARQLNASLKFDSGPLGLTCEVRARAA